MFGHLCHLQVHLPAVVNRKHASLAAVQSSYRLTAKPSQSNGNCEQLNLSSNRFLWPWGRMFQTTAIQKLALDSSDN